MNGKNRLRERDVFFPSFYFACLTDIILHYGEHDYCHNCLTGTKGLQMFDWYIENEKRYNHRLYGGILNNAM